MWCSEQGSSVRTDTVLIISYFLEAWRDARAPTITKSFSLRLRKLVYPIKQPLIKMFVIRMANLPLHLLPFPPATAITSIPYNTITKPSHDPGKLLYTSGSLHLKFTTFLCYSPLLCSPMYSRRVPLDLPNHGLKYVRSLALY